MNAAWCDAGPMHFFLFCCILSVVSPSVGHVAHLVLFIPRKTTPTQCPANLRDALLSLFDAIGCSQGTTLDSRDVVADLSDQTFPCP